MSFSFDKVTIGSNNFVSFLLNVAPFTSLGVISAKIRFLDQVKINSTSQLINGIFKALHNYFIRITIFAFVNESLCCLTFKTFRISRKKITWFISVIIPQSVCYFFVVCVVFN